MQSTEEEIEEDLSEALRAGDTVYFMESLIEQCADRIQRHIKRRAQGVLDADEQAIVYSETLKQIFARISEPGFTVEKPLPFVFTVAKRRTIDATRKKTRLTIAENGDELLGEIVDRSKAGGVILKWRELSKPEKDEFNSIIANTLVGGKLTRMQGLVVQAYVDHLLKFHDVQFKDLIQPLQDATGTGYRIRLGNDESFGEEILLKDPIVNGRQILAASGRRPEKDYQLLMLTADGGLEEIGLEELVDLRTRGAEKFFVFETDCLRAFEIDDRRFLWGDEKIPEHTLRFLGNVGKDYSIWQEVRGCDDRLIGEGDFASLAGKGVEVFFTGKDQTNAG